MAKRNGGGDKDKKRGRGGKPDFSDRRLHPDTKKSIWALSFIGAAIILILAGFRGAGPAGDLIYRWLSMLFGWGYFILPATLVFAAIVFFATGRKKIVGVTMLGAALLIFSFLGLIDIASPANGGWFGLTLGSLRYPFGKTAAAIIDGFVLIIAILVTANIPIKIRRPEKKTATEEKEEKPLTVTGAEPQKTGKEKGLEDEEQEREGITSEGEKGISASAAEPKAEPHAEPYAELKTEPKPRKIKTLVFANYVPPPISLLNADTSKPTTGDLLANANVIKRTLESFGIAVEMGEINVGPAVTRYTLKPAEGMKLSRITALNSDLALALAAHPIRIEAPIPGKSLVGIEVPNKAAALVRLGSLMHYPEFQRSGPLGFVLGRNVSGEPIFADIEKMPHMLVAGATGSGKSILIHSLLISLLYKNSPQTLKFVLIDPKRVELSAYNNIPHLVSPVITENKKAVSVFRWAISEMERRYEILQKAGSRDTKSYNASHASDALPYILIAIDEMADLMTSYGREVEGSVVRLAQMARATGIHLLLATQRPSVEIITGLIKANITTRIALQVASQIDSRTILDTAGAEKLLGHGDFLFVSAELSKPKRIQGSYVTEEEIKRVADFIREHNKVEMAETEEVSFENGNGGAGVTVSAGDMGGMAVAGGISMPEDLDLFGDDGDDELFDEALTVVKEAQKASASLLQRRLKVGYARAARLLDLMEAGGLIGPGDGAKPRDVNIEKIEERLS